MEINLELLIEYAAKLGYSTTININSENNKTPELIFQALKYRANSNTKVILEFKDIDDILILNNIGGWSGKIRQELDVIEKMLSNEQGPHLIKWEKNKEKYIYDALAKYIIQMLNASHGKIFFPEIMHLEKHNTYFKN